MATSSIANLKVDVSAIMPNETVMLPLDVTPKKRVSLFSKLMDDPRVDMLKEYGEKAMGYGEMAVEKGKEFVFKKDSKPT
jgi:orotidine-5'-phosphate decarboxylase